MSGKRLAAIVLLLFAHHVWAADVAPPGITDKAIRVADGGNEFATELYASLRSDNSGNLFFCPYGISEALAMAFAGARDETEAQMARVMRFPLAQVDLHPAFSELRFNLAQSDKSSNVQLRIANRLWGQKGYPFVPAFLETTKTYYGAELGQANFRSPGAASKLINAWIDKQTDHRIRELIGPGFIEPRSRLVLTNAVYFKANWTQTFDRKVTTNELFHYPGQRQVRVPMMRQKMRFRYMESEQTQVLELPYASRGLSMLILLPKRIDGLNDLEKGLTRQNLEFWISRLQSREVNVHLPKFKMSSEIELKPVLERMGMHRAFDENRADFLGICAREQLFISAVVQKTFVEVHEEGTEATAATAVGWGIFGQGPPPAPPIEFRADHPFVFLIRDDRTHCIVFMGSLVHP